MNEFLSLTDLGKLYGVSSHQIGRCLKEFGFRTPDGKPSENAFRDGMVKQVTSTQPGTYFYIWDQTRTCEILDKMGYEQAVPDHVERIYRF